MGPSAEAKLLHFHSLPALAPQNDRQLEKRVSTSVLLSATREAMADEGLIDVSALHITENAPRRCVLAEKIIDTLRCSGRSVFEWRECSKVPVFETV